MEYLQLIKIPSTLEFLLKFKTKNPNNTDVLSLENDHFGSGLEQPRMVFQNPSRWGQ